MIVDSMTWAEIAKYLKKQLDSQRYVQLYSDNPNLYKRFEKADRSIKNSRYSPARKQEAKIWYIEKFPVARYENEYVFLYTTKQYEPAFQVASVFHYKNHKYIAMLINDSNKGRIVTIYSWHVFRRYAERYLQQPDKEFTITDILSILLDKFNICTRIELENGTIGSYCDYGALLSRREDYTNEYHIIRTYISLKEFFENQKDMYNISSVSRFIHRIINNRNDDSSPIIIDNNSKQHKKRHLLKALKENFNSKEKMLAALTEQELLHRQLNPNYNQNIETQSSSDNSMRFSIKKFFGF